MTKTLLTKEQKQSLVDKIKELASAGSTSTNIVIFEEAIRSLKLPIKVTHASTRTYFLKAGLGKTQKLTQPDLPPEVAIQNFEKGIQEQVRRLVARRDELAQQQLHLDNLISKYKAVR